MLLDVLSGLDELKVAVAYEDETGRRVDELPGHARRPRALPAGLRDAARLAGGPDRRPALGRPARGGPRLRRLPRRAGRRPGLDRLGRPRPAADDHRAAVQDVDRSSAGSRRAIRRSGRHRASETSMSTDAATPTITEEGLARIAALGLRPEQLPRHVAIIMDGNGRWAQSRGLPRIVGHRRGIQSVRAVVEEGCRLGLDQLTLYCLSVENWKRPAARAEVPDAAAPPLPGRRAGRADGAERPADDDRPPRGAARRGARASSTGRSR